MTILVGMASENSVSLDYTFTDMGEAVTCARDLVQFAILADWVGEVVTIHFDGLDFDFLGWGEEFFLGAERFLEA